MKVITDVIHETFASMLRDRTSQLLDDLAEFESETLTRASQLDPHEMDEILDGLGGIRRALDRLRGR